MTIKYIRHYETPQGLDDIIMCSDGECLTGLCFEGHCGNDISGREEKDLPVFEESAEWLDAYFAGRPLRKKPKIRIEGLTPFRKEVIEIMKRIPYGKTVTYGDIAREIAEKRGIKRMSAQAVGQAVGWNPICIIIPCHRVIGSDASLTGYGGGIENKKRLLDIENGAGR
ncbi:MAG: methylated-DNA--[Erysipelotrichaceae bacterium]|nr:methylated-DNA--[protein]-cysteine S-methyltransferase [Erysipelotrichaceae bacterium]